MAGESFVGVPAVGQEDAESSDVVLFGVPTDAGVENRPGVWEAPTHVRRMSWTFGSYNHALGLDIFEILKVADGGDLAVADQGVDDVLSLIQQRVYALCRGGQIPGLIGGSGLCTLGALRGVVQAKRRPVTVLHLSASHGLRRDSQGESGMLRLAQSDGLLKRGGVLQVGVRGPSKDADETRDAFRYGFERQTIDNVRWDIHAVMEAIRSMTERHTVYVSVDLACLDPSVCPGVSRPSPGGLTSWELQQILRSLVGTGIVGFDIVGLCPRGDTADLSSTVAVSVLHELLSVVADSRDTGRVSLMAGSSGRTSA